MDLRLPGLSGVDAMIAIRSEFTGARIDQRRKRVPPDVAAQLAQHMSEESLTAREVEVLRWVAAGNRNREIAELLCISEETVKVHVKHIIEKLGAKDRTQAIAVGVRRGIIEL
jgi:DNA-binding NarL/FixJ family response regulator